MSNGKYPILTDYDLGERVDSIVWNAGLGMFVGNVPTVGAIPIGGGGGAVTLDAIMAAVGPATIDNGSNVIDWQWDFQAGASPFTMHDRATGDVNLAVGGFNAVLAGRRGDGRASLFAYSATGAPQAEVRVNASVAQPSATLQAFAGAALVQVDATTVGLQLTANSSAPNGIIHNASNHTFRDVATSPAGEILQLGPGLLSLNVKDFLRINNAAPGTGPSVFAVGAGANIPITLVPKGTSSVQLTRETITADNGQAFTGQTSGAGASAGTLANAPSAGDPAFWLRVVVNGANRFIPCWA